MIFIVYDMKIDKTSGTYSIKDKAVPEQCAHVFFFIKLLRIYKPIMILEKKNEGGKGPYIYFVLLNLTKNHWFRHKNWENICSSHFHRKIQLFSMELPCSLIILHFHRITYYKENKKKIVFFMNSKLIIYYFYLF